MLDIETHSTEADDQPNVAHARAAMGQGGDVERRALNVAEVRVVQDDGDEPARIEGHAAVFDEPSSDLGGFVEIVHPGAFTKTIKEADIRALYNHNEDRVLGRNRAGTLALAEDDHGLAFVIWPPSTTWAADLIASMARGDIDQGSFGFKAIRDEWEQEPGGPVIRHLYEARLFDVSIVTFPAYPQTNAEVRAQAAEFDTPAPGGDAHAGGVGGSEISRGRRSVYLARARLELAKRGRLT